MIFESGLTHQDFKNMKSTVSKDLKANSNFALSGSRWSAFDPTANQQTIIVRRPGGGLDILGRHIKFRKGKGNAKDWKYYEGEFATGTLVDLDFTQ